MEKLTVRCEDNIIYEFLMPMGKEKVIDEREPDFYKYIQIKDISKDLFYPDRMRSKGETINSGDHIVLEGNFSEAFFNRINETDEVKKAESCFIHYHAPEGFLNDPNGLVYDNGIYHIYHQHNPVSRYWENMTWGHAVTKDFIHYDFVSDTICPDEEGVMFSGCGIKNDRGCFDLPKDALLFFYTCFSRTQNGKAARKGVQKMAYSLDQGKTLIKYPGFVLDLKGVEDRDPKVFYHEESQSYIMALYLNKNRFVILRSENLKEWKISQELSLVPMWECPDLVRLKAEDGCEKWAFISADGYYYTGDFDGYEFKPHGVMKGLYDDKLPYAAQSFSNVKDRVISIAWLRTKNTGENFTGYMSVPRELSLAEDENGYYIKQKFVKEVSEYVRNEDGYMVINDGNITEKISPDGKLLMVKKN
ncbi:MAG: glycoside hydrolase family 32 protein [Lachnospiraceae bacterium]|nr:glycoside hydrolase family 32 protein [Lachnospiraceae bacterium]